MWVLEENPQMPGVVHYLPCNTSLKVTRATQAGHVLLHNDKSISRDHATLYVLHESANLGNPSIVPKLLLTDTSSKYGTYVNDNIEKKKRVDPRTPFELINQDRISFGILSNIWRAKYTPFIVTSSQVSNTSALGDAVLSLGGHLVNNWTAECSLLIMNEIILTIKTVCAMASCKPIVTPSYVSSLKLAVENKETHPDPSHFLPPVKELSIVTEKVSFAPNEKRRNLFCGKTFLFSSEKTLKKMKAPIFLSGGRAFLLNEETFQKILQEGVLVVKASEEKSSTSASLLTKTLDILKHNNLNCIPESDIGLAILYVSTENYCNSTFNTRRLLRPPEYSTQAFESLKIYATETQEVETQLFSGVPSRSVIPESGQSKKSGSIHSTGIPSLANNSTSLQPHNGGGSETCISNEPTQAFKFSPSTSLNEDKENSSKRKRGRTSSDEPQTTNKKLTQRSDEEKDAKVDLLPKRADKVPEGVEFDPKFHSTPAVDFNVECRMDSQDPTMSRLTDASQSQRTPSPSKEDMSKKVAGTRDRNMPSIPFEPFSLPSLRLPDLPQSMEENFDSVSQARLGHLQGLESGDSINTVGDNRLSIKREIPSPPPSPDRKRRKDLPATAAPIKRSPSSETPVSPLHSDTTQEEIPTHKEALKINRSSAQEESEFALPMALASRRRTSKRRPPASEAPQPAPVPIKRSASDLANDAAAQEGVPQQQETSSTPAVAEPFIPPSSQTAVKEEPLKANGEVDELGRTLKKSLVMVEVKSLLRKSIPQPSTSTSSTFTSSLPNFKKFRKSVHGSTILNGPNSTTEVSLLPKIIGGRDLFVHTETSNRIEEFMLSQPSLNRVCEILEEDRTDREEVMVCADKEFNLPMGGATRRARRR